MQARDIIIFVLILFGIFLSIYAFFLYLRILKSKRWKEVDINIIYLGIKEKNFTWAFGEDVNYYPHVVYEYTVDGNLYRSSRISPDSQGHKSLYKKEIDSLLSQIAKEKIALYNPNKPSQSVLMRSVSSKRYSHYVSLFFAGLLISGISVGLFIALH